MNTYTICLSEVAIKISPPNNSEGVLLACVLSGTHAVRRLDIALTAGAIVLIFAFKTRNCALKTRNCVLKTRDCGIENE